jgi:iron complex transport system substrate-binding protein
VRIVSICPSNTEIACVLGLGSSLVGLDRSSDFPETVTHLPRVGPDLAVDVDAIAALKPDLVLSSLSVPGMEKNLAGLDAAGLPHLVMDAESIDGVFRSIRTLGRLVGAGSRADDVVAGMVARLDAARARAPSHRPKVFLEWWPKPVIVPGRRCWTTEMITIAGGDPLFADLDVRSTPIHDHEVPPRAPDILLTCWCGVPHERQVPAKMAVRDGWSAIPGVRSGQLHAAPERYFGRPGPRLVDGVEWLQDIVLGWSG